MPYGIVEQNSRKLNFCELVVVSVALIDSEASFPLTPALSSGERAGVRRNGSCIHLHVRPLPLTLAL